MEVCDSRRTLAEQAYARNKKRFTDRNKSHRVVKQSSGLGSLQVPESRGESLRVTNWRGGSAGGSVHSWASGAHTMTVPVLSGDTEPVPSMFKYF